MDPEKKTFYLIDGSSYIYRAFYAIGRLTDARGMATQAIYGFAQMLLKVLREKKPDYVCVIFDAPTPNFRHELFNEYKSTRQRMPEDLTQQIPYIKELVRLHGVPSMEVPGFEADDIIAVLSKWAAERAAETVIVSGDKDLCQLVVDGRIVQWDPQKDRVLDEAGVMERFGVKPWQMTDYLALVGDSSDNIPGVKGVGEKTARVLMERWNSLDEIYQNLDSVTPESLKKKLRDGREMAYLSRRLVSFNEDLPVPKGLEEFAAMPPMRAELMRFYENLGFRKLLEALRDEEPTVSEVQPQVSEGPCRKDEIILDRERLAEVVRLLLHDDEFALNIETSGPDAMNSEIIGIAISREDSSAFYIPVGHKGPGSENQLPLDEALQTLAPLFISERPGKVGHNIKFERIVLKRHGIDLRAVTFDPTLASYLLDASKNVHTLDWIAAEHFGETLKPVTDFIGKGRGMIGFADVDVAKAAEFACEDAETTWRLVPILRRRLKEERLHDLFTSLEIPLSEVLARMEYRGILVDAGRLERLSGEFEKALEAKAVKIYDLAKEPFNIQSPKQLACILFEKLGLPVLKKTKSGPSTDVNVLEELALQHPLPELVLEYRALSKLKGTYADALFKLIHPQTGRIHTSFNQAVTATGRLSSSDPNLQNIPIRSEEGLKIREAFIAPPGWVLYSADYSQIELRILAHYSGDEQLVEAFREGVDVHARTAARVMGVPLDQVTPTMRRQAKMINFGIIYGMGPFGLAQRLRISQKVARVFIDRYFQRYRGVKDFIDLMVKSARETGYSETLLGRRRPIPELQSRNHNIRQLGERLAINTPIQGTAADLIKKAMIDIEGALERGGFQTRMLLQVHDELVFEAPIDEIETAGQLIRDAMENVWELKVPLRVDVGWGKNWAEAHA